MAYSNHTYTGNGSTTQFNVPFDYIRKEHVYATVAGLPATFTWVNSSTIQMDATPANGTAVRVYRVTPLTAPLVDFTDGATLVAADLDTNAKQSIYTQQELYDGQIEGLANVIPDGDKGDIVTSVGATVWTIDSGAVTSAKIADGTIVNTDINASAAIAGSKINPNFGSQNIITSGDATIASLNGGPIAGSRNRIINGDMRIDQRNAGTAATFGVGPAYILDRWTGTASIASNMRFQQVTDAPTGFTNSHKIDAVTGATIGASSYFLLQQRIEGYNVSDFAFGTASAATVTLSFWVKSSVTGTHSGSLRNGGATRSYPYNYTISAANTWEKKSITIPGDTTGTWLTDNGAGLDVFFDLGTGSTLRNTAGAWVAGNYAGVTGAVSPLATAGTTWYITGVQLEPSSTATPFERRSYGAELALCQRYYVAETLPYIRYGRDVAVSRVSTVWVDFPVTMRATPSTTQVTSGSIGPQTVFISNRSLTVTAGANSNDMATLQSYTAAIEL